VKKNLNLHRRKKKKRKKMKRKMKVKKMINLSKNLIKDKKDLLKM
jgi:hypothetical protein